MTALGAIAVKDGMKPVITVAKETTIYEAARTMVERNTECLLVTDSKPLGTYREKLGEDPVCYLRLISGTPEKIAKALRASGFNVLGMHRIAAEKV